MANILISFCGNIWCLKVVCKYIIAEWKMSSMKIYESTKIMTEKNEISENKLSVIDFVSGYLS
jgi:hypothetical protein